MNVDSGEKTWLTPKWLLDMLGTFDLDPCVPDGGMPWPTAKRMVTKSEDGLACNWDGCRVWLNPPYGREAEPFFKRMVNHTGGGIALVFVRTDTNLWQRLVFPKADAILFMWRRLRFCDQAGNSGQSAPTPSALISYSSDDTAILARSAIEGTLVLPAERSAWYQAKLIGRRWP